MDNNTFLLQTVTRSHNTNQQHFPFWNITQVNNNTFLLQALKCINNNTFFLKLNNNIFLFETFTRVEQFIKQMIQFQDFISKHIYYHTPSNTPFELWNTLLFLSWLLSLTHKFHIVKVASLNQAMTIGLTTSTPSGHISQVWTHLTSYKLSHFFFFLFSYLLIYFHNLQCVYQ